MMRLAMSSPLGLGSPAVSADLGRSGKSANAMLTGLPQAGVDRAPRPPSTV